MMNLPSPWIVATHNAGKLKEIAELLEPLGLEVISAAEKSLPEPEETGLTFQENAAIKSESAATATGLVALADDSGIAVDGLDGAPGIYSARWAGESKDFHLAMERIHNALENRGIPAEGSAAEFVCVLSLTSPEGETIQFTGTVKGTLTFPPQGGRGFGYDPIFIPDGYDQTFGEMLPEEKHKISHRADAFNQLLEYLKTHPQHEQLLCNAS